MAILEFCIKHNTYVCRCSMMTRRRRIRRARQLPQYSLRRFLWFLLHFALTILTCGCWLVVLFVWWLINNA